MFICWLVKHIFLAHDFFKDYNAQIPDNNTAWFMKASLHILTGIAFIALTACSTQEVKQDTAAVSAPAKLQAIAEDSLQNSAQDPPLTLLKDDKTLNLVRIMDGGACKNDFQGAKGAFLVYADPADIERIKGEKGPQIFSDFEIKIQAFAT